MLTVALCKSVAAVNTRPKYFTPIAPIMVGHELSKMFGKMSVLLVVESKNTLYVRLS